MQNVGQTIVSQYANSPNLNALIASMNAAIDPVNNINLFYNNIFNVATATGYGLDVWGRIVGVSRVIQLATGTFFGFSGPNGGSGDSFDAAPFYSGGALTSNYALTDDAFRQLIYAKALTNISNGSIPAINMALELLFHSPSKFTGSISGTTLNVAVIASGQILVNQALTFNGSGGGLKITSQVSGTPNGVGTYTINTASAAPAGTQMTTLGYAYCGDGRNMTMTYVFSFTPSPVQLSILAQSRALPRTPGVSVTLVHP